MHNIIFRHFSEKNTSNVGSIVDWITILTFITTIVIFLIDSYFNRRQEHEKCLNRLLSLKFELQKNTNIINKFINEIEKQLLSGSKVVYYRYDTLVTESLISSGEILDSDFLRNLDAILGEEKQINRLLDSIEKMADMSHVDSGDIANLFKNRITTASNLVVSINKNLTKYYPKVIDGLGSYIRKTEAKKFLGVKAFNVCTNEKEIKEEFWKEKYQIL